MNSSVLLVFGILLQIPPFSFQNLSNWEKEHACWGGGGEGNVLLFARLTALIKKKNFHTPKIWHSWYVFIHGQHSWAGSFTLSFSSTPFYLEGWVGSGSVGAGVLFMKSRSALLLFILVMFSSGHLNEFVWMLKYLPVSVSSSFCAT